MSDTNLQTALENLQSLVDRQRKKIDDLTEENKKLQTKIKDIESSSTSSNKDASAGVENGPSKNDAANALALKFGAKAPPANTNNSSVENGPTKNDAANALAAKLGAKKVAHKPDNSDSVDNLAKESDNHNMEEDETFKKYEKMLKLGISVNGAIGRMIQDGVDKKIIDAFKAKHSDGTEQGEEEKINIEDLGFKKKPSINLSADVKMKRLHWDPIPPTRLKDTIWQNVNEENINYNLKEFELQFQVRARKPVEKSQSSRTVNSGNGKEKISFLSTKRSQQVLIGVRGIGLTNEQLRNVLHNMDEKVMTQDKLTKLMDIVPTQDEQTEAEKEIGQNGNGDANAYAEAEQFFYNLCDFYHLEQRLRLWLFKMQFNEVTSTLLEQFKNVQKTCDKVKNSKGLLTLLAVVLAFGNHMNAGTKKSDSYGFELKVLPQLSTIKSFDNSRSLMMYMYEFCDKYYPKSLGVVSELLELLKRSSSTEMEVLTKAYEKVKDSMKELQDIIETDEVDNYDADDSFVPYMGSFYKETQPSIKKFNMTVGNVSATTKRLLKKFAFGTEDQPESIESLFKVLYEFLLTLEQSKEKLTKLEKERAKKQKQKSDKKEKSKLNTLQQNVEKQLAFEEQLEEAKNRLGGHIRERSTFVRNGGDLEALPETMRRDSTMRRISSMYRENQEEERKIAEARQRAAIMHYNKFQLPTIPHDVEVDDDIMTPSRLRAGTPSFPKALAGHNKPLPDDLPIQAPPKTTRNPNTITSKTMTNNTNTNYNVSNNTQSSSTVQTPIVDHNNYSLNINNNNTKTANSANNVNNANKQNNTTTSSNNNNNNSNNSNSNNDNDTQNNSSFRVTQQINKQPSGPFNKIPVEKFSSSEKNMLNDKPLAQSAPSKTLPTFPSKKLPSNLNTNQNNGPSSPKMNIPPPPPPDDDDELNLDDNKNKNLKKDQKEQKDSKDLKDQKDPKNSRDIRGKKTQNLPRQSAPILQTNQIMTQEQMQQWQQFYQQNPQGYQQYMQQLYQQNPQAYAQLYNLFQSK